MEMIKKLWTDESGQGLAEYGLILALVAIVIIASLTAMGTSIKDVFTNVVTELGGSV